MYLPTKSWSLSLPHTNKIIQEIILYKQTNKQTTYRECLLMCLSNCQTIPCFVWNIYIYIYMYKRGFGLLCLLVVVSPLSFWVSLFVFIFFRRSTNSACDCVCNIVFSRFSPFCFARSSKRIGSLVCPGSSRLHTKDNI